MPDKVVILDRDGTICEEIPGSYVRYWSEFKFIPGALDALTRLKENGYKVFVFSNQSGVGKGVMTEEQLREIHREMCSTVFAFGGEISGVFYCPHRAEDGCDCRKPKTGLLLKIERDYGVDLTRAWVIGDSLRDVQAGKKVQSKTILLLSGEKKTEEDWIKIIEDPPHLLASNLGEAVGWITENDCDGETPS